MGFVNKYGLPGLMSALPTTPHFMSCEAVYLFRNHFVSGLRRSIVQPEWAQLSVKCGMSGILMS